MGHTMVGCPERKYLDLTMMQLGMGQAKSPYSYGLSLDSPGPDQSGLLIVLHSNIRLTNLVLN